MAARKPRIGPGNWPKSQEEWEAHYKKSADHAMKLFITAARKVERLIAEVRAGDRDQEEPARRGIEGLYNRANKAEIAGYAPANELANSIIRELMQKRREAAELGYEARQRAYQAESARLTEEHREKMRSMPYHERELYVLRYKGR